MKNDKMTAAIAANPVLVLFLGACPAMAQSGNVISALGMSCAVLVIMVLSALLMSLLKKAVPECARIPVCILIVAGFTALVQLGMNALLPGVFQMLGVYLALAAVDIMILGRVEASAQRGVGAAVADSFLTGLGFAAAMLVMAAVREILGSGSFAGIALPFFSSYNIPMLSQASGGFIVFAILLAAINGLGGREKQEGFAAAASGLAEAENEAQGDKV